MWRSTGAILAKKSTIFSEPLTKVATRDPTEICLPGDWNTSGLRDNNHHHPVHILCTRGGPERDLSYLVE